MKKNINNIATQKSLTLAEEIKKNKALFIMLLPGILILLLFNYLPMFGVILAFKNFKFYDSNFFSSLFQSQWTGFKNFQYLFASKDALLITSNTLLYNTAFIIIGLLVSVGIALMLNEIRSRRLARFYQSALFIPYFLSWVVVSYIAMAFLNTENGFITPGSRTYRLVCEHRPLAIYPHLYKLLEMVRLQQYHLPLGYRSNRCAIL